MDQNLYSLLKSSFSLWIIGACSVIAIAAAVGCLPEGIEPAAIARALVDGASGTGRCDVAALAGAGLLLLSQRFHSSRVMSLVDWELLVLFMGLFVVNHALELTGATQAALVALLMLGGCAMPVREQPLHGVDAAMVLAGIAWYALQITSAAEVVLPAVMSACRASARPPSPVIVSATSRASSALTGDRMPRTSSVLSTAPPAPELAHPTR